MTNTDKKSITEAYTTVLEIQKLINEEGLPAKKIQSLNEGLFKRENENSTLKLAKAMLINIRYIYDMSPPDLQKWIVKLEQHAMMLIDSCKKQ